MERVKEQPPGSPACRGGVAGVVSSGRLSSPSWVDLPEEQLLKVRICDLGVTIEGSELVERIQQLHEELERKGLVLRPVFYLGDEWFSPEDSPSIALPFYLAHPRLKALEQKMMMEVEGGDPAWCQRLLRHECGHAIEHAYQLHRRRKRKELFGSRSADYDPDTYRPQPYSKSFVRHLPNWYAQAHPDEDWAETFAVWLDPAIDWRKQYRGWDNALAKLELVEAMMKEIGGKPPLVTEVRRDYDASSIRATLESFYKKRRRVYATDLPDFYDGDLRRIFPQDGGHSRKSAAAFLRRSRKPVIDAVSRWTGERKAPIEILLKRLTDRAQALGLSLEGEEAQVSLELAAFLATLVTNYRFTGKFKRSV